VVTGLPNRTQLQERLHQTLTQADAERPVSLLILDLDHFKEVNDAFGHHVGDRLLQQVGPRIQGVVRNTDLIARLGGDEFAVLLNGTDSAHARQVAEKIIQVMQRPFEIDGHPLAVEASLGIVTAPEDGRTADILIRRADLTMYVAKRTRGSAAAYDPQFEQEGAGHLSLMAELRKAISENGLTLHYQPIVELNSGRAVRFEALLRWNHPRLGMVPPDQFIPFAERTGVIQPLTDWVIKAAVADMDRWQEAGQRLQVAVNVSVRNLLDGSFPDRVARLIEPASGGPAGVTLEVTESLLMAEPERIIERMLMLRRLGVRLSVDDFGTGYSSLAYLARFPVQEMKIDRSFTSGLVDDSNRVAIVRAAVDLGHNLRLEVVAEGVEDRRTLELLSALGCDTAQGYFIGKPMPADDVLRWMKRIHDSRAA
jgi:diguanylate cyclase (GGDEF)-like protein